MNHFEVKFQQKTGLSFREFYKVNKPKLIWHLARWTGCQETAEDFAEDAFIQALNKIDTYDPEKAQPHTWLYTIATNMVKKDYQDRQKLPSTSLDKELVNNANVSLFIPYNDGKKEFERYLETCKKADIVKKAIHEMPEKQIKYKRVLIMRELENMTYNEIAEQLKLNLSTVKSQIKKGREIILKKVEKKLKLIDVHGIDV